MKSKIYIGIGILLLVIAALAKNNTVLNVIGGSFFAVGAFTLFALSSGVDYTESHYRIYNRILFWKTGPWKSIGGVRKIYIRHYSYVNRYRLKPGAMSPDGSERVTEYQVYFVRKSGNYKIFSSTTLQEAREKAGVLATKYNLLVKEKAVK
ncbi:MAG: hypothetical protein JWM14_2302 [Chitinophagaceae bacterium]|nr:hypothetical protein [Chitinophagaceae bacterium]